MGLNDIELPVFLLAGLYKENLVDGGDTIPVPAVLRKDSPAAIQYLGNNQKNICMLVSYESEVYIPEEQLNFLSSILQACKLNLGDVAIVNCCRQRISFEELKKQLHCNFLFIFGVETAALGLGKVSLFSVTTVGGCSIVLSPEPGQLNNTSPESKLLKSKLWLCLKQLFNV